MAWTDPMTAVDGQEFAAAQFNQYIRDNLNYLKLLTDGSSWSAVHVTRAAAQSVPDSTDTTISFDTELTDAGGWYTSGTNIVVPAGAIPSGSTEIAVHVIPAFNFAMDADGIRRILLLVDGSEQERRTLSALSADPTAVWFDTYLEVAAGQIITVQVHHTAGANLNVTGGVWVVRHAASS